MRAAGSTAEADGHVMRPSARRRWTIWRAVGLAVALTGLDLAPRALEARPTPKSPMQSLRQLIRGRADDGAWVYVLAPMTSRVLPADAVLRTAPRYPTLDKLANACRKLPAGTLVYLAEPNWFGPPRDRMSELPAKDVAHLRAALAGLDVRVVRDGP